MSLLKISNLKKSYKITKTEKQDVLKGVNIEFKSGDLVALLGESGCGKSTLINILGGLDTDYTGSVVIKGDFIRDFDEKQMDDYRKKRVGLIFQNYNLIKHMTVLENVEIAMAMSNIEKKTREERAMDLLKLVGLHNFAKKLPNQLSGGQKQRVAIARALANNPTILLADEPTGALDKDAAETILTILKKIAQKGKLVIIVTHSQKVADECGRIIKIDDGKIVSDVKNNNLKIEAVRDKEITPHSIDSKELFKISKNNLKQNKKRGLLVSVGMAIGLATVIIILALSSGLASYVNDVFTQNITALNITAYKSSGYEFSDNEVSNVEQLEGIEDVTVASTLSDLLYVASGLSKNGTVATLYEYYDDFEPDLLYGLLPASTGYIMVNETFASSLYADDIFSVIGQVINISYNETVKSYTVSGIYDDISDDSDEINAYITNTDMTSLSSGTANENLLYITASDSSYVLAIIDDLNTLGYETLQADSSVQTVLNYIDIGTGVLTGISAISMVVAAIMIFIVMYISVVERMKEIGILRAIGARKSDIRKLFIFEAGMLGLIGGLISCALALIITILTNIICLTTISASLISYNILYYLIGLSASVIISILAGISPAIYASELDPVDALRYE
ncbi:MAG: ATP-binding cassette domain-containing protein [Spirochaetales bacterium]